MRVLKKVISYLYVFLKITIGHIYRLTNKIVVYFLRLLTSVVDYLYPLISEIVDYLYWLLLKHKYPIQNLTISFILINFLLLYSEADYKNDTGPETNFWVGMWFVIEAWIYALFALICTALNFNKKYRVVWGVMFIFLSIRAIWEISAVLLGVSVNEKIIMSLMFYLTFLTIFIIAFYPYVRKIINLCRKLFGARGH